MLENILIGISIEDEIDRFVKKIFSMKKITLSFIFIFFTYFSFSQENSYSVGANWGIPFYYRFIAGGSSKSPKTGINLSFDHISPSEKKTSHGFGFGYQLSRVGIKPAYWGQPEEERVTHVENAHVLTAYYKFVFRKRTTSYFSIDPLLGVQLNKATDRSFSNQSGFGFIFTFNKKIFLTETNFILLQPKLSVLNIWPFFPGGFTQRMTSVSINIGLGKQ